MTSQALTSMGGVILDNLLTLVNVSCVTYVTDIPPVLPESLENQILKCI